MIEYIKPRKRPRVTKGTTPKIKTGCGTMYVTLRNDKVGFCEVFIDGGRAGGCVRSQREAIGRLISLVLRLGGEPMAVVNELKDIGCPLPEGLEGNKVLSCADGIAQLVCEYAGKEFIRGKNKK